MGVELGFGYEGHQERLKPAEIVVLSFALRRGGLDLQRAGSEAKAQPAVKLTGLRVAIQLCPSPEFPIHICIQILLA